MKRNKIPLGVRLNNPFNIRYSSRNKWLGQVGNVNGFCKFASAYYGVRAFALLYRTYISTGRDTISRFISSYAPCVENNTGEYIHYVCDIMGCDPDYKLSLKDFYNFARIVCGFEIGNYVYDFIDEIINYRF